MEIADTVLPPVRLTAPPINLMTPTGPASAAGEVDCESTVAPVRTSGPGVITSMSPAAPEVLVEVLRVLLAIEMPGAAAAPVDNRATRVNPPSTLSPVPEAPGQLELTQMAPAGPVPVVAEEITELLIWMGAPSRSISPACWTPLVAASNVLLATCSDPLPLAAFNTIEPRVEPNCVPAAVVEMRASPRSIARPVIITAPGEPAVAPAAVLIEVLTVSLATPTCTVPLLAVSFTYPAFVCALCP